MKKLILLAALAATTAAGANAQGLQWGARAGLNAISDDYYDAFGFYVGLFAERRINDAFGVQGEILYSAYSETEMEYCGCGSNKMEIDRSHLLLPVMGKLYLSQRFSFDFGPQFGVSLPDNDSDERFDFALGAGLSYRLGGRFDLSARYHWGLTEREKGFDERDNTFRIGLGYRF